MPNTPNLKVPFLGTCNPRLERSFPASYCGSPPAEKDLVKLLQGVTIQLLWPLGRAVVLRCWVLRLGVCPPSLSFRAARRAVADDDLNLPYAV